MMNDKVLNDLYQVILDRKQNPAEGSYTCYLFDKGLNKILKKVGEECAETIIAANIILFLLLINRFKKAASVSGMAGRPHLLNRNQQSVIITIGLYGAGGKFFIDLRRSLEKWNKLLSKSFLQKAT